MARTKADYRAHFDGVGARYDAMRRDPSDETIASFVAAGDLAGRRVVDVGAGTGRVSEALTRRYGCDVLAVEPSDGMIANARERAANAGFEVVQGASEDLPVESATRDRALMQMVVHLVDRSRALPEVRRVLRDGGRFVISTLDTDGIDDVWLSRWVPSYPAIERARFPAVATLLSELRDAGFARAESVPYVETVRYSRDQALERLRGRYASSLALVADEELDAAVERATRELPDVVEFPLRHAFVVGFA